MGTSTLARSTRRAATLKRRVTVLVIAAMGLVGGYATVGIEAAAAAQDTQNSASLKGMGTFSGTVVASKPFKAAQVYLRNVDKRIQYMVYTNAGAFRAVARLHGDCPVSSAWAARVSMLVRRR